MENQINLETITDVTQLKALKAAEYDKIAQAQQVVQASQQNLQVISARISQLTEALPNAEAPQGAGTPAAKE